MSTIRSVCRARSGVGADPSATYMFLVTGSNNRADGEAWAYSSCTERVSNGEEMTKTWAVFVCPRDGGGTSRGSGKVSAYLSLSVFCGEMRDKCLSTESHFGGTT